MKDRDNAYNPLLKSYPDSERLVSIDPQSTYNPRAEYVYFILCEKAGAVKIGRGWNPRLRMRTFQCGNPLEMKIAALIESETECCEREMHRQFESYRIRNEWFRYEGDLRCFVAWLSSRAKTKGAV